ncbi:uncharacterized protein TNCV_2802241 [Trichonephila clavipes]|nr:uncharacterized protein TNCV_2802241 [Trichonephila clavipes]
MTIVFVYGDPVGNACFCFAATHHSHSRCDGMEWHCLQYTVTPSIDPWHHETQWYVRNILQPHVLPLMQRPQEPFFNKTRLGLKRQGCRKTVSALLLPFLGLSDPQICLQLSISWIIWDGKLGNPRV